MARTRAFVYSIPFSVAAIAEEILDPIAKAFILAIAG